MNGRFTPPGHDAIAPLFPGDWKWLGTGDAAELEARLIPVLMAHQGGEPTGDARLFSVEAIRAMPIACYRHALLCEAVARVDGRLGAAAFLFDPFGITLLDGRSLRLHERNEKEPPALDNLERAAAYLRLFCNCVHGDEGRFRTIEDGAALGAFAGKIPPDAIPGPISAEADPPGWRLSASILYGSALFSAIFRLQPTGDVEMTDDDPVCMFDDHVPEHLFGPFRLAGAEPMDGGN